MQILALTVSSGAETMPEVVGEKVGESPNVGLIVGGTLKVGATVGKTLKVGTPVAVSGAVLAGNEVGLLFIASAAGPALMRAALGT